LRTSLGDPQGFSEPNSPPLSQLKSPLRELLLQTKPRTRKSGRSKVCLSVLFTWSLILNRRSR
jgi:hypothetical protein